MDSHISALVPSASEEWSRTMNRFFQILSEGVERFEFTGDGIMALFGAPIAHEDHARSAPVTRRCICKTSCGAMDCSSCGFENPQGMSKALLEELR
jgi:class 3 adenylate cyclase